VGRVIFLVAYSTLRNDIPLLLGLSILSGLGTASVADIVLMMIKHRWASP
jgi:ABC-type transporter Mla maintaining outer membrane lipid asymmetry permease subunit MlaE